VTYITQQKLAQQEIANPAAVKSQDKGPNAQQLRKDL